MSEREQYLDLHLAHGEDEILSPFEKVLDICPYFVTSEFEEELRNFQGVRELSEKQIQNGKITTRLCAFAETFMNLIIRQELPKEVRPYNDHTLIGVLLLSRFDKECEALDASDLESGVPVLSRTMGVRCWDASKARTPYSHILTMILTDPTRRHIPGGVR